MGFLIIWNRIIFLLSVWSLVSGVSRKHGYETCQELDTEFTMTKQNKSLDSFGSARYVNVDTGNDNVECLNYDNVTTPPPCRTFGYAVSGGDNVTHSNNDVAIYLGPGVHILNEKTRVVDTNRIAIIGSGVEVTFGHCGNFLETDSVCNYTNLQARNSTYMYISGITFTRCGPITSSIYLASSNFIFVDSCSFRDSLSPPVLVYDTPSIVFNNVSFTNNHPQELPEEIVHDRCYFSGGQEVFFLDNRTTSGAISFYVEDWPTNFLISDCTFVNNSARPDSDVAIARFSKGYGHGGAITIRLLNSTGSRVCIKDSTFVGNYAEAHAGALAISLAGVSTANQFYIIETVFDSNYCEIEKCTGGAVGIDFFSDTEVNKLEFSKVNFTRNRAQSSGAISLSTFVSALSDDGQSDQLILDKCHFEENEAFFEGTAFGAFSLTHANQIGVPIEVYNCHFDNNRASGGSDTTAVTAYRVLISFFGNNTFNNNFGGGLSLLSSRMDVKGNVSFYNNTAVFGGGIAMSGRSLILLYENSSLDLISNKVSELGAGIYVEFASSDFVLSVLNTGCFIRYFSEQVGIQPTEWKTRIRFINNTAQLAGAAIYANDMSRCEWVGSLNLTDTIIFEIPEDLKSPFTLENNVLSGDVPSVRVQNANFATDASNLTARTTFNSSSTVSYGEKVSIELTSFDQLKNFRESVWSVNAPLEPQPLGSLSSNGSTFVYDVPSKQALEESGEVEFINNSASISAEFAFLQNQVITYPVNLTIADCHPGYTLDNSSQQCVCQDQLNRIVRCDSSNRYFYVQDGIWVGVRENNSIYFSVSIPGFLQCTREGSLQGCEFRYDDPDSQCADGRTGRLCGDCIEGYASTFDLRFCKNDCGPWGIILFLVICFLTFILSVAVLYFDFPLPNELKGVIFFAQVIGVVYRNTPYLLQSSDNSAAYDFFDFLINFLGFAMPFPICLWPNVPAAANALLGFFPPLIAIITAFVYICGANRFKFLGHRENYGFHGFYFLFLFIYKYFLDTSFIFISCTRLEGEYVFSYQGTLECFKPPFVILFVLGIILVIALGLALPVYALYIIYQPKKMIQVSNALTHGLKQRKRYLWYGVWDIWRRLLFVVANLFLSVSTRSTVLFIDCIFILLCLCVICAVQPYKKYHINFMEAAIILSLLGASLSILDQDDIYVGPIASAWFIAFPFLYAIVFITYRGVRKFGSIGWNRANKKWNLLERSYTRRIIEKYKMAETYVGEKKEKLTMVFMDVPDESLSQNRDSGNSSSDTSQQNSGNKSDSTGGKEKPKEGPITIEETCTLREPLLDELL